MLIKPSDCLALISNALFAEEDKRLFEVTETMVNKNHMAGGSQNAFLCEGKIISHLPPKFRKGIQLRKVVPALEPEARRLVVLMAKLEHDKAKFNQCFGTLLTRCRTNQNIRDVLPDDLVNLVSAFRGIERMNEPAFLLRNNPTLTSQFEKVRDIISYYLANRLLY